MRPSCFAGTAPDQQHEYGLQALHHLKEVQEARCHTGQRSVVQPFDTWADVASRLSSKTPTSRCDSGSGGERKCPQCVKGRC